MSSANISDIQKEEPKPGKRMRRSELPIYTEKLKFVQKKDEARNEFMLHGVQLIRSEGCKLVRSVQSLSDRCSTFLRTGIAHTTSNYMTTVDYLREERNILQRIGAISGGVLFGYILGIRKGFFKRLLYTTSGGISAAAVCYPSETEDYLKYSSHLSKKYMIISYHFLNGVSKDLTGYELPTFPLKTSSQEPQESAKKD